MRLFLAIELPLAIRENLCCVLCDRRSRIAIFGEDFALLPTPTWVQAANLHVTLKFFGEVREDDLPSLLRTLEPVRIPGPIPLRVEQLSAFPPRGALRVIVATIGGDLNRLALLHREVEDRCHVAGFPKERRPFQPHVTVARCRTPLPALFRTKIVRSKLSLAVRDFAATELVMMASELSGRGSVYTPVARFSIS